MRWVREKGRGDCDEPSALLQGVSNTPASERGSKRWKMQDISKTQPITKEAAKVENGGTCCGSAYAKLSS